MSKSSKEKFITFINKILSYVAVCLFTVATTFLFCIAFLRPEWLLSTPVVSAVVGTICFVIGILLQRFFCDRFVLKLQAKLEHKNQRLAKKNERIKALEKQLRVATNDLNNLSSLLREYNRKSSDAKLMKLLKEFDSAYPKFKICEDDELDHADDDDDDDDDGDDDDSSDDDSGEEDDTPEDYESVDLVLKNFK